MTKEAMSKISQLTVMPDAAEQMNAAWGKENVVDTIRQIIEKRSRKKVWKDLDEKDMDAIEKAAKESLTMSEFRWSIVEYIEERYEGKRKK
jgi:RNA processing factor Prp31